jgi:hypothetical protein
MAIVKRLGAPYTITTTNNSDTITLATTSTLGVIISGNLTVLGNTAQVNSNVTSITDNFVTLNSGETGNGVSLLGTTSGIEIDRGSAPGGNVKLQWNEGLKVWQVSGVTSGSPGDSTLFSNLSTTSGSGGTVVFDDKAPVLGGNLNINGFVIYGNTGVYFGANLSLINSVTPPQTIVAANTTTIYTSTPSAGSSGVYVVNSQTANQELVTKARAVGFSLLL